VSGVIRRLIRRGAYDVFERLLIAEKKKRGVRYVPADAVGLAVMCPRYAAHYASELEIAAFARSLLDRVRYAELLKIADASVLRSVVLRAARGDRGAVNSLLEVGSGLSPGDIERILPELQREFERYSRAARGPPPRGLGEGAYYFYNYAEILPYAGFHDAWEDLVIYSIAGISSGYVYIFKYTRGRLEYSAARSMAAAEADVAARIWRRPRAKLHIQEPGRPPRLTFVEPRSPEPRYKALRRGECRRGPLCHACPLRVGCECVA
jgi:hypothetical protein